MLLEICAYNIRSCITAQQAGAARIELCADPGAGGTTPSYGLIEYALQQIGIPVFPMIRPRGGDFVYDAHELAIMKKDILVCRGLGCPGIATGILTTGNRIDTDNLARIVEWAHPMQVTCHKAFDRTTDAIASLEDVIAAGCSRILTSGLQATALEGAGTLAQLVAHAAGRIVIMPGGGVRSANLARLVSATGASEYHSSGLVTSGLPWLADHKEVEKMADLLQEN